MNEWIKEVRAFQKIFEQPAQDCYCLDTLVEEMGNLMRL